MMGFDMCPDCIETKDKALTYAKCSVCGGWRPFTSEEQKKIDCLDKDGNIIPEKWGKYKKERGLI